MERTTGNVESKGRDSSVSAASSLLKNRALAGPKRETPSHCSTARLNPLKGSDLAWLLDDSLRCSSGETLARCCRNVHTPIEHVRAPIFPDILQGADNDSAVRWVRHNGRYSRPVET